MIGREEFLKRLARHADGPGAESPTQTPTEFTTCVLARLRDLERDSPWATPSAARAVPVAAAAAPLSLALDVLTHHESSYTTEPETSLARRIIPMLWNNEIQHLRDVLSLTALFVFGGVCGVRCPGTCPRRRRGAAHGRRKHGWSGAIKRMSLRRSSRPSRPRSCRHTIGYSPRTSMPSARIRSSASAFLVVRGT